MMYQTGTTVRDTERRGPDWRGGDKVYRLPYLMKLGGIGEDEALALIARYKGDRDAINAELVARKRRAHQ
jgi:hypothetical protein